jgi:uncharacterized protein (TIGR00661 family)
VRTKEKLISAGKSKVLLAPMDWGLGHATRCIPLVNALQNAGIEVIIAAEGAQFSLLQKEFPHLKFIHLQGYRIRYSTSKRLFAFKIATQLPKILLTVYREHKWLKQQIAKHEITMVISDNRYGLFNKNIFSVFLTHQLNISVPKKWMRSVVQQLNYKCIENFNECWIPDIQGAINVAGELAHPEKLPAIPVKYIGILSRFSADGMNEIEFDHCALISGPEPQRTIFETIIMNAFEKLEGKKIIIRGKPSAKNISSNKNDVTIYDHVEAAALQNIIKRSRSVIARAGYSTIMDLIAIKKTALLVPTPGQTEQEYLATYLANKKWFSYVEQEKLSAEVIILAANETKTEFPVKAIQNLDTIIESALLLSSREKIQQLI